MLGGIIGLFVLSISLGVILIYLPGAIFGFYRIKPEYFGPIVTGSIFGHVSTLIVIASMQKWIKKRYGPNEALDAMRKSALDDIDPKI